MIGKYLLFNQQLIPTNTFQESRDCELVVYEVFRVLDSIPLFYSEHFERLGSSCNKINKKIEVDGDVLYRQILNLIRNNMISDGNIIIKVCFHSSHYDLLAYFIPHIYPTLIDYENGVEVGFLNAERNTPEAKVEQASIRGKANQIISEQGLYEVLLIDDKNQFTEGSRSNLFFIQNNTLITSPLNTVLKGVTLSKVLEIAVRMKLTVEYKSIKYNDLSKIDALFLTGTSPNILPIKKAGNLTFDVKHPILIKIIEMYDQMVKNNINNSLDQAKSTKNQFKK